MSRSLTRLALLGLAIPVALGCDFRGAGDPRIEARGAADPSLALEAVRIATINVWGVSAFGFDWSDHVDERFAALAERLARNEAGLDLVFLQEAWKDSARRALLDHPAVVRNFPHQVDAVSSPGGSGLVALSRLPIAEARFHRFGSQGSCWKFWEADCLGGKGVLAVRVQNGRGSFWFGNTHAIACYAGDGLKTSCDESDPNGEVRERQILEARRFMEELAGSDPAVVVGDFNFTRTSRYYPLMAGWTEPGDVHPDPQRIDYLWTRPGDALRWHPLAPARRIFAEPVVLPSGSRVPLSDHPALASTLCLVSADDPEPACPAAR